MTIKIESSVPIPGDGSLETLPGFTRGKKVALPSPSPRPPWRRGNDANYKGLDSTGEEVIPVDTFMATVRTYYDWSPHTYLEAWHE